MPPLIIAITCLAMTITDSYQNKIFEAFYFILPLIFTAFGIAWTLLHRKGLTLSSSYKVVFEGLASEKKRRTTAEFNLAEAYAKLQDLASRKNAEFQALLDASPLAIIKLNSEGKVTLWNSQAEQMLGWKAEEVMGLPFPCVPENKRQEFDQFIMSSKENQDIHVIDTQRLHKDGHLLEVSVWNAPVIHPDPNLKEVLKFIADITDRKKTEDALQKSIHELAEAQRLTCIGNWYWNIKENKVTWSHELFIIFDHDPLLPPLTYEEILVHHPEEYRSLLRNAVTETLMLGKPYALELQVLKHDKSVFWVMARGEPIRNELGEIIALRGTVQDITAKKKHELNLAILSDAGRMLDETSDYDERMHRLAKLSVPFFADFNIIYFQESNSIFTKAAVHKDAEVSPLILNCGRKRPHSKDYNVPDFIMKIRKTQHFTSVTSEMLKSIAINDEQYELLESLNIQSLLFIPLIARDKFIGCMSLGMVDPARTFTSEDVRFLELIASRASISIENATLFKKAKDAIQDREHMLSVVSHDLKSPLMTIQLSLNLMRKNTELASLNDKTSKWLEAIEFSGQKMSKLIKELLLFSKIESGTFKLDKENINIEKLLSDSQLIFSPQAIEKNISLEYDCKLKDVEIYADKDKLDQALANLVGNAIKFTPASGKVKITATQNRDKIQFSVVDSGPGIPESYLEKIFDRYWQKDPGMKQGSGLGLSIAKGIVQAHEGDIWAESKEGQGCGIYFTIPANNFLQSSGLR